MIFFGFYGLDSYMGWRLLFYWYRMGVTCMKSTEQE